MCVCATAVGPCIWIQIWFCFVVVVVRRLGRSQEDKEGTLDGSEERRGKKLDR